MAPAQNLGLRGSSNNLRTLEVESAKSGFCEMRTRRKIALDQRPGAASDCRFGVGQDKFWCFGSLPGQVLILQREYD